MQPDTSGLLSTQRWGSWKWEEDFSSPLCLSERQNKLESPHSSSMLVFSLGKEIANLKRSKCCGSKKKSRLSSVTWQGLPHQQGLGCSPLMLDRHNMGKDTTTLPVGLAEVCQEIERLKCLSPTPAPNMRCASTAKAHFDTPKTELLASWILISLPSDLLKLFCNKTTVFYTIEKITYFQVLTQEIYLQLIRPYTAMQNGNFSSQFRQNDCLLQNQVNL